MSGSNVPYHLRPNKFVERQLFLEILERVGHANPLSNYVYVSMGGRFLEDFKLIHSRFSMKQLVSIEAEWMTYDRQVFNRPLAIIRCLNKNSHDFIVDFASFADKYEDKRFIVWLDYAAAKERREQLQEFQSLVEKMTVGDVVKITLNANPETLGGAESSGDETQKKRFNNLKSKLSDFFPEGDWDHTDMTGDGLCQILAQSVKKAALDGVKGLPQAMFLPLGMFRYNDAHHQMLTVTGTIIEKTDKDQFLKTTQFNNWEFLATSWEDIHQIAVPDLSVKERITLDEMLFAEPAEQAHAKLPFKFSEENNHSLRAVEQYVLHYNRYPSFMRVTM